MREEGGGQSLANGKAFASHLEGTWDANSSGSSRTHVLEMLLGRLTRKQEEIER